MIDDDSPMVVNQNSWTSCSSGGFPGHSLQFSDLRGSDQPSTIRCCDKLTPLVDLWQWSPEMTWGLAWPTRSYPMTDPWCWYIYANIKGVQYIDGKCYHYIYIAYMDPVGMSHLWPLWALEMRKTLFRPLGVGSWVICLINLHQTRTGIIDNFIWSSIVAENGSNKSKSKTQHIIIIYIYMII